MSKKKIINPLKPFKIYTGHVKRSGAFYINSDTRSAYRYKSDVNYQIAVSIRLCLKRK